MLEQAVVLAGGIDPRLNPLCTSDHPKCLLPVANSPVLLYSLMALKHAGITSVLVVGWGDTAKIQKYVKSEVKLQGMSITVISVANHSGSADAVRAVADKLSGDMVVVMSGDTVTDLPLDTVLFTHRMRGAVASTVLAQSTSSAAATTKPGKIPKGVDYVALEPHSQRVISYAYDPEQLRRVVIPQAAVKSCSPMTLSTNYRDASIYILSRKFIAEIQRSELSSIKVDCLPKLVSEQWGPGAAAPAPAHARAGSVSLSMNMLDSPASELHQSQLQHLAEACPAFRGSAFGASAASSGDMLCSAYMASPEQLCRRVNTLQSLLEVNREMASSEAGQHIIGTVEMLHPTVERGNKAVVGAGCLVAQATSIGDRTSIKRSVVGASCKIGANVKIWNSLIMDEVVISDNALIQNSVIGHKSVIGSKAQLKDCFVAHERHVRENADHRDEELATSAPES
eukprot:jgi/Ulvmu1/7777/UM004_0006.1